MSTIFNVSSTLLGNVVPKKRVVPGGYDIFVDYLGSSTCSTWKDEPKLNLKSPGDSDVEHFSLLSWKSMIAIYDILRCSSSHIWIECNQVDNLDMRLWEAVIQVFRGLVLRWNSRKDALLSIFDLGFCCIIFTTGWCLVMSKSRKDGLFLTKGV